MCCKNVMFATVSLVAMISLAMLATNVLAYTPPATKPIVSINYVVKNDEDARPSSGYWALDDYIKTITIWDLGAIGTGGTHNYIVRATYSGTFCTYAGVLAPHSATVETNDGCGTMTASYDAVINNTVIATGGSLNPTSGSPGTGTFDFGGSRADILGPQNGNTGSYSWVGNYFPTYSGFCYISCPGQTSMIDYQWAYTLPAGTTLSYTSTGAGTPFGGSGTSTDTGDIITSSATPLLAADVECNSDSDCPQTTKNTCINQACVPVVCGLTATGGIQFGSVIQGTTTEASQTTTVTNTGNVQITPTITGDYWYGSQYATINDYMPIGATQWSLPTPSWIALSSTPTGIGQTLTNKGDTATIYYQLKVPAQQITDSYTQAITFSTGC